MQKEKQQLIGSNREKFLEATNPTGFLLRGKARGKTFSNGNGGVPGHRVESSSDTPEKLGPALTCLLSVEYDLLKCSRGD